MKVFITGGGGFLGYRLALRLLERRTLAGPDGKPATGPWHLMTYDFRMKPGVGTAPKPMMAEVTEAV